MSLIDDAVAKARALRDRWGSGPPKAGTEVNAIKHDRFDEWSWRSLQDDLPILGSDIADLGMKHDQVADFFEDMYNMLHKGDPKTRVHKDMDVKHKANVDLANHFLELPDVQSLRVSTMHDDYATAMGMRSLKEAMRQAYELTDSARQQYQQAADQDKQNQANQQALTKLMAQAAQMEPGDPGADGLASQMQALMDQIQADQGITDQMLADAAQAAADAAKEAEQAFGNAAKDANEELDAEKKRAAAFGIEDGELQRMDYETRAALAEKLRRVRDVDAFANIIGQGKNMEMGEFRKRITNNPDEISGVRLSNDLTHLTSGEYMNLAIPEMETDLWRRYSEDMLLTYELSGTERMGKGPIICIVDESGSMQGPCEQWAAAITLMLAQRCQRDGRDFTYIGFSSRSQQYRKDFPKGKAPIEDVIDVVTHFFCGGTHYEEPLGMAAEIVDEAAKEGNDKPDIVFITDDAYHGISDEFITTFNEVKARTSMRVFGILLGGGTSGALEQISDNVRTLDDVSNLEGARDIFRVL